VTALSSPACLPFPALRRDAEAAPAADRLRPLVERARAGDDAAFGALYHECRGRVYALCLRLEADAARADELLQDVFVRAWERLGSYRGESRFSTWLHRLAVNVVLQDRRASWRRERRILATPDEMLDQLPSPADATAASRRPADMDLDEALPRLPPGARAVFVLHDVEGYPHEEIAAMLGVTVGTTKTQLFRARRILREALG
jgi:RNA polymerase sigma-70 factor, ECF subfamily